MKKVLFIIPMVLLVCIFMQNVAFADLAPDPGPAPGGIFPIILYAIGVGVLLAIAILIIRKMRKKGSGKA